jgi:ribosomal protein S20
VANIKSSKKRILVAELRAARNKAIKSKVKTASKKVELAITAGNKEEAVLKLREAVSAINKAKSKGVYHRNNAARKVSKLTKAVNTLA